VLHRWPLTRQQQRPSDRIEQIDDNASRRKAERFDQPVRHDLERRKPQFGR
jgi:hypothetical protein